MLRKLTLADGDKHPGYGFGPVCTAICSLPDCLQTIVGRLGSAATGDALLVQASLGLVNALMKRAVDVAEDDFLCQIERLDVRTAVIHLVESSRSEDLAPLIVQFQTNVIAACHADLTTPVDLERPAHRALLDEALAQLKPTGATQSDQLAAIGLHDEDVGAQFDSVGVLGLRALVRSASVTSRLLAEQANRPAERQCPLARASNLALETIADLFDFTSGQPTASNVQPLLLAHHRVHALAVRLFFRIWTESGATNAVPADFTRVATLVRSQVKTSVCNDGHTSDLDVERDFANADYRTVRDRLSKELAVEDDLLTKAPVRTLRGRLYKESYDCVRQQRIRCMQDGAWFLNAGPGQRSSRSRTWRFFRLSANCKQLHWVETTTRTAIRGGLEDLPERIDLSLVTDIVPHPTATANATNQRNGAFGGRFSSGPSSAQAPMSPTSPTPAPAPLGFSLLSGDTILADLQAVDSDSYSEWLDGLALLRPDGVIFTSTTADLVQSLTELGVKIKLLDLSGERIEIPVHVEPSGCPVSTDFFYASSDYDLA